MRVWGVLFLILVMACEPSADKYAKKRGLEKSGKEPNRIYVQPSNRLFFLNVRSLYYDKESNPKTQLDFYRYGDRVLDNDIPVLNLVIVDAKYREEAYLVIEPNEFFENKDSIAIKWVDSNANMEGYFTYTRKTPKEDYEFLQEIYPYLYKDNILMSYKDKPLFDDLRKKVFRKTFKDFEKLISEK